MRQIEASDANRVENFCLVRPDLRNHSVSTPAVATRTTKAGSACVSAIELTSRDVPSTACQAGRGVIVETLWGATQRRSFAVKIQLWSVQSRVGAPEILTAVDSPGTDRPPADSASGHTNHHHARSSPVSTTVMAGAVIAMGIPLLVFVSLQRVFLRGIGLSGAIK